MGVTINKKKPINGPVMALDVSTKTGLVMMGGGKQHWLEIGIDHVKGATPLLTRLDRMKYMFLQLDSLIVQYSPALAVVEGYGYANPWSLVTLVEIGTIVRAALHKHKIPIYEVGPNALKKFVLGKGAGKKDEVRLGVYKRWNFEHKSDNIVDAFVLAHIGMCLSGQSKPATKEQAEVVEAILHPKVKKSKKSDLTETG